jgi:NAD(P)-dependent dehydrogenase (short-subunit alcohol dehydrogenase family)
MTRVLVTGGTGNIGRQVVYMLLSTDSHIRALTRNPDTANLPPQVEVVRGDLTDAESLDRGFEGVDVVFLVWTAPAAAAPAAVKRIARHAQRIVLLDLYAGCTLNSVAWDIRNNNVVGVEDGPPVSALRLQLAGANPTPDEARFRLSLPQASRVRATIYDAMGRAVRSLFDGWQEQGTRELRWDGRDEGGAAVPAGLYFTRVSAMGETATLRVVRVR